MVSVADIGLVSDNENLNTTDYYLLGRYKQYYRNNVFLPLMIYMNVLYHNILKNELPAGSDYDKFKAGETGYIGTVMEKISFRMIWPACMKYFLWLMNR